MKIFAYITMFTSAFLVTSCDLDKFPEGGTVTEDQKNEVIKDDPEKLSSDLNSLKDNMIQFGTISTASTTYHTDYGFPAICLMYDQAGQDMVSDDHGFNWFSDPLTFSDRIPTSSLNTLIWKLHYQHIKSANSVLNTLYASYPEAERTGLPANYIGQALASRAFDYLQLIQTYQFTYIGHEESLGLPIITEKTSAEDATNNPRATVKAVYDLIIADLNSAIDYLENNPIERSDKGQIDASVAYGLRARANMLLGNYAEAASDADKALIMSNATPYTKEEVSIPSFNNDAHSWIWGSTITSNNDVVTTGIINWPSHLCSLTGNGYTTGTGVYFAMKRINNTLWNKIPETDIRKTWWLDEDKDSPALKKAYGVSGPDIINQTGIPYVSYVNVKFGPQGGELFNTENSQDWPLMRAEEMILIKAEALARSKDVASGKKVLEDFVKSYRDDQYVCSSSSLEDFIDEVWFQRRVELWGEGFSLFDILRLKKPIIRLNTNFADNVTYNDIAPESPIMIYCIPECETSSNKGITLDQINEVAPAPIPVKK